MKLLLNPIREYWPQLATRPYENDNQVNAVVRSVIDQVRKDGDKALFGYTKVFENIQLDTIRVSDEEIRGSSEKVPDRLKAAIEIARKNIETFHQVPEDQPKAETMDGVTCWKKWTPIETVGLYIPNGTSPLFSTVLMLGVPAIKAGCRQIQICTPCGEDGKINPVIAYAASILGIQDIFKVGGAQAVAAMAYGTETIPAVDKIFGPGNQYVTAAKQMVSTDGTSIDIPAGPSELAVLADAAADPEFVAADLLSQAEHGIDSQVVLVSTSRELIDQSLEAVNRQLSDLPRKEIAGKALEQSIAIYFDEKEDAIAFVNFYAPEHLILAEGDQSGTEDLITNAGSVFVGNYTPESAGDYASGTNHTLPTGGFARSTGGVSVESFMKHITFQHISKNGLNGLGETIMQMAEAENLEAHKRAVSIRIKNQ